MRRRGGSRKHLAALAVAAAVLSSALAGVAANDAAYDWQLPADFPRPRVPADNPMSAAKVELGRHLFYDTRMSVNGTQACSTCHQQARAFTDGKPLGVGATGQMHPRGPMSLVNVAYQATLTWANPAMKRLEDQALVPMYGDHPIELGLDQADKWVAAIRQDDIYPRLFQGAFPDDANPITRDHIIKSIAAFERSIISARAPYDRYHSDRNDTAVSPAVRRGERLFFNQQLSCFRCHGGFTFAGGVDFEARHEGEVEFHNTGLYNLAGLMSYPGENTGIYEVTHDPADVGKFKAPTLRNIAVTAPYMHDGSIATLPDVIAHYAAGGRTIAEGPHKGIGHDNPNKSAQVRGFTLAPADRDDLIAFLESLTDDALLHDPRFADPWPAHRQPGPH